MGFNKLTLDDLVNIRRQDTAIKASVKPGDLIKVSVDKQEIIGIVLSTDGRSMQIQNANGDIKWMSLYVIYEVLQYNNKKGDTNGSKKKNNTDEKRKA